MDAFLFYLLRFAPFIILLGLIIFGIYWILKKTGHKVAGVIFSSALVLAIKLYLEGIHLKKSISKAVKHLKAANRENDHRSAGDILMMLQRDI